MAIGDEAKSAGYALVPESGTGGEVRYGAREINRTRDYIAQVKKLTNTMKITSGTGTPSNSTGANGDVYFKIV